MPDFQKYKRKGLILQKMCFKTYKKINFLEGFARFKAMQWLLIRKPIYPFVLGSSVRPAVGTYVWPTTIRKLPTYVTWKVPKGILKYLHALQLCRLCNISAIAKCCCFENKILLSRCFFFVDEFRVLKIVIKCVNFVD